LRVYWIVLLIVAFLLRALPLWLWGWDDVGCTRDECIYATAAEPLVAGRPLEPTFAGWLPAPGYPWTLALSHALFGSFSSVKWVQVVLSTITVGLVGWIGRQAHSPGAGRVAGLLTAIHPTLIFFAGTQWTETVYIFVLLSAVATALFSLRRNAWWAIVPGVLLGVAVLFRGIATYLPPIFAVAMLVWSAKPRLWKHAAILMVSSIMTFAPYSVFASKYYGGFMISDATLGHVAGLGNDNFQPTTFDYGIGQLSGRMYNATYNSGRGDCPRTLPVVAHDRCETDRAVNWVKNHPVQFLKRIPLRLAQLFNPHTFLTRHVRWGLWPRLPWAAKEAIVIYQVLYSYLLWVLGSLGAAVYARKAYGVIAVSTVGYHVAVIACLYGISRFRLPLEPLWIVFAAGVLAHPRDVANRLRTHSVRAAAGGFMVAAVIVLMSRYVATGFTGWW